MAITTEIDKIRTLEMTKAGYKVLRFWEHEINKQFDYVKEILNEKLEIIN